MEWVTHSAEETEALAARLAGTLSGGEVLAFTGGLGAGKTAFVRGLCRGLECPAAVSSPTFALMNEYRGGRLTLFHFDLYRIETDDDLAAIGYYDAAGSPGTVTAVEWSENVPEAFGEDVIRVRIEPLGDDVRRITVEGVDGFEDPGA